jgi:hypothetical protein
MEISTADTPPRPNVTLTNYELLAAEILRDLDAVAAKIPKLEAYHQASANLIRAHVNVPGHFLVTAVAAIEQTPEFQRARPLEAVRGHDTLQYLKAFGTVRDRLASLERHVKHTMDSRKARLAQVAFQIYSVLRGLSRDARDISTESHIEFLQRDLGKRGRPRKKRE